MSESQKDAPVRPSGPRAHGPFGGMMLPAEKAKDFKGSARRLAGLLGPERVWVGLVILLGAASVALSVTGPKILGNATTVIFEGFRSPAGIDFTRLHSILFWVIGIYVAAALLGWAQGLILNAATQRTVFKLRSRVEDKIHVLPLKYFDEHPRGDLLSRVTNDIDNISQTLQQTLSQLFISVLTVVGVVAMMFSISWQLALIALVSIPVTAVIVMRVAKRSQKMFVAQWKNTGDLNAQIEEMYTGHALVKVFGRHKEVGARFAEKNDELYKASFGAQFVSGIIMPATMFVGNLVYVAIAVVGGIMVAHGSLPIGDIQAFIQYSRQFSQPLAQLGSMANLLQSGVASAERVFELLDADPESPDPGLSDGQPAKSPRARHGELRFENVAFRYVADKPLIHDLSLVAVPGKTVAIVGPTGAGKTTLVNLIMRFYELDAGRITLDGVDIATMTRDDLRARTGMVLQDTWLFEGTIRENILYGRPDATEKEMHAAAEAAYVDRFVHSLPDGYDTVLDDNASNISAGEKQLITIARAFLARPSVLIRDADLILVMEEGAIVEQGTHAQLLKARGAYSRLYEAQFAAAIDA
jgi:ATP-binding cassette subfamily B multidrug efflux pump